MPDGDQIGREMLENIVTQADGICSAFNIPFVGDESYDIFDYQWKGAARRSSDATPNTDAGSSISGLNGDNSNEEGGGGNSGLQPVSTMEMETDPQAATITTSQVTPASAKPQSLSEVGLSSSSSSGTLKDDDVDTAVDVDHLHGADAWSTEIEIESTESEILNVDLSANVGGYWTPLKEEVSVTFDMLDIQSQSEPIAESLSTGNLGDSKAEVADAENNDDDRGNNNISSSSVNTVTAVDTTGNGAPAPVTAPIGQSRKTSKMKKKSAGSSAAATTGTNSEEYSSASATPASRRKS